VAVQRSTIVDILRSKASILLRSGEGIGAAAKPGTVTTAQIGDEIDDAEIVSHVYVCPSIIEFKIVEISPA
jgi:hypothetical protein